MNPSSRVRNAEKEIMARRAKRREWELRTPERAMVSSARIRAKRDGVPCTITFKDAVIPDRCPVLGITLQKSVRPVGTNLKKNDIDNSPTLDRIIPSKGYVPGNVAVISHRANRIKNDSTIEEMQKILDWLKDVTVNGYFMHNTKIQDERKKRDEGSVSLDEIKRLVMAVGKVSRAAAIAGVGEGTIYYWLRGGRIPHSRLWRVDALRDVANGIVPTPAFVASIDELEKFKTILGTSVAAKVAGVNSQTIYNWLRGLFGGPSREAFERLKEAAAKKEIESQEAIQCLTIEETRAIITLLGGQKRAGEAAGISQSSISRYDQGLKSPGPEMSAKLREAAKTADPSQGKSKRKRRGERVFIRTEEDRVRANEVLLERRRSYLSRRRAETAVRKQQYKETCMAADEARRCVVILGGQEATGRIIGVDPKTAAKWFHGKILPSPEMSKILRSAVASLNSSGFAAGTLVSSAKAVTDAEICDRESDVVTKSE
jgi:transcriptional regulator with XRE-family HTH domain